MTFSDDFFKHAFCVRKSDNVHVVEFLSVSRRHDSEGWQPLFDSKGGFRMPLAGAAAPPPIGPPAAVIEDIASTLVLIF